MDAINVQNITKSFGDHQVLKDITLTIKPGEIFTLLGENGAGKSTLINILTTLSKADSGQALVFVVNVKSAPNQVRKRISLNSQNITLDDEFSGYENLKLIAELTGINDPKQRIAELSKRLDLTDFIDQKVGTYSGGMKRRLDIAASLLADTQLIFLDEPTTGVDPKNRLEIWQLIKELKAESKTIFLTTQYLDEADHLSDQIAFINDGRISLTGTPDQLKKQTKDVHEITVSDHQFEAAGSILSDQAINYQLKNDQLQVLGSDLQPALRALIDANITILNTEVVELSLEEIFLDATKKKVVA